MVHRDPILDRGFGESIQGLNVNSVYVDQFEPKFKKPNPGGVRRVTRSSSILSSTPVTIQQSTQPIVVQLEDDVLSSIPAAMHISEPIPIVENLEKSLAKKITDLSEFEIAPSFMDACGSGPEPSFMSIPLLV